MFWIAILITKKNILITIIMNNFIRINCKREDWFENGGSKQWNTVLITKGKNSCRNK